MPKPADDWGSYDMPAPATKPAAQGAPPDDDDWKIWQLNPTPSGNVQHVLPDITNEDIKGFGRKAPDYAPLAGATAATALAPELSIPAMAGIAALGGAGGEGVRQGALRLIGDPEAPQSTRQALVRMGESGIEQGAGDLGGRLLAKPLGWIMDRLSPTRLYGSALKPFPSIGPDERTQLINTGLRERIPVTEGGLVKLQGVREAIGNRSGALISGKSGQPGTEIDPQEVTRPLINLRQQFSNQVNPHADLAAIDNAKREFLDKHSTFAPFTRLQPNPYANPGGPGQLMPAGSGLTRIGQPLSLAEAQAEKQGTYRVLAKKYGELGSADTEAQKGLARGLRAAIEKRVPEVGPLNAREGRLIELEGPLSRSLNREGNRQLIGLRLPLIDLPTVTSGAAIGMNGIANSPLRLLAPAVRPRSLTPFVGRAAVNAAISNK